MSKERWSHLKERIGTGTWYCGPNGTGLRVEFAGTEQQTSERNTAKLKLGYESNDYLYADKNDLLNLSEFFRELAKQV